MMVFMDRECRVKGDPLSWLFTLHTTTIFIISIIISIIITIYIITTIFIICIIISVVG